MKASWLSRIPLMSSKASVLGLESSFPIRLSTFLVIAAIAFPFKDGQRPGFRQTAPRVVLRLLCPNATTRRATDEPVLLFISCSKAASCSTQDCRVRWQGSEHWGTGCVAGKPFGCDGAVVQFGSGT